MNLSGLRGRKVVERVRHKGRRFKGVHMQVTYMMGSPRTGASSTGRRVMLSEASREASKDEAQERPSAQHDTLFVGTAASTKLDKSAVRRNRMRRRCREALRLAVQPEKTLPSCQLIIVPRSSSLTCAFDALTKDAKEFLRHLKTRPS